MLYIALLIGGICMCLPIGLQMKWYDIPRWKCIPISLSILITGLIGSRLMFFVENGYFEGLSFFGAVFLMPLTFIVVAKMVKIPYLHCLDIGATAGCLVFALLKINCLIDGCCDGIILYVNKNYMYVRFPSQIVEFATALIITVILLYISKKGKFKEFIYPLTLILYGSTRFVLNFLRDDWERAERMNLPIPIGNVWSLVSIIAGAIWLIVFYKKRKESAEKLQQECI